MVDHSGLIDLWEEIHEDPHFEHLRKSGGGSFVPGIGANSPIVMVVGEAPGAMEVAKGIPFCGRAGVVLRELMDFAGLSVMLPGNAWITTVIKYRLPGNRTPRHQEILDSRQYISREWKLIGRPPVIVAVGQTALTCFRLREEGHILDVAGRCIVRKNTYLWPMVHPAFGLREPSYQDRMEQHWSEFGAWLLEQGLVP